MSRAVIITCAITGTRPQKSDNPAVPITPAEQIESTQAAFEAGAAVVHIHVRDDRGGPTSDPARFAEVVEGVRKHCPGIIVEVSTGGRGRPFSERPSGLATNPDMASLCAGSVNFPYGVYDNPPDLVEDLARRMKTQKIRPTLEIFDLSHIYAARGLIDRGLLVEPVNVLLVTGLASGLPARRHVVEFLLSEVRDVFPTALFTVSGLGAAQAQVMDWSLYWGGHLRTGLEDNIRRNRTDLAASNAELVRYAATLCVGYGAHAASPAEARGLLGLP